MAGWLIVWTAPGKSPDRGSWERSIRVAGRYGEAVEEVHVGRASAAAWRRTRGEFPFSGMLHHRPSRAVVAWVGQCLGSQGDATTEAIDLLDRVPADFPAAASLNGLFAAAMFDERGQDIRLWTDRHRHYPIYFCQGSGVRVASTDMSCLIPWVAEPQLNRRAVSLLLASGELIDRPTLVEGIELLPPATLLDDDDGGLRERQYWKLEFRPSEGRTEEEWANEISSALKAAVARIEAAGARLGVPLSGGLDSRLLLGLCSRPSEVPSFTWGLPGCRDLRYAAQFAQRVHSPHQAYHWDPDEYPPMWAEGVDRTAGSFGIQDMFVLPYADRVGQRCDAILNGLAGDVLLGGNFLKQAWLRETNLNRLAEATWSWRVKPEQEEWTRRLLGRDMGPDMARQQWVDSICSEPGYRPIERLREWLYANRVFRFTNSGTMLLRRSVESYAPFFDRDVVDLLTSVPSELKWKHRLYIQVLKRACPAAAKVPWQRTAISPAWGFRPTLAAMAAHRAVRMLCRPLKIEPFRSQAVADVAGWMRGEWAPAIEGILLDDRTLDRRLVEPDALRSLWQAHQQGQNCTRQLGTVLAMELFARTTLDQTPVVSKEQSQLHTVGTC